MACAQSAETSGTLIERCVEKDIIRIQNRIESACIESRCRCPEGGQGMKTSILLSFFAASLVATIAAASAQFSSSHVADLGNDFDEKVWFKQ